MGRDGVSYYYHADGLGSITHITDATGNIVQNYVYSVFGEIVAQAGGLANPYTYTSREYDPESGLYYYRARYYDAKIGRFLQTDPIRFTGGNVNLYAYVQNNPVNLIDPLGLVNWRRVMRGTGVALAGIGGVVAAMGAEVTTVGGATAVALPLVFLSIPAIGGGITEIIVGAFETQCRPIEKIPSVRGPALVTLAATGDIKSAETADLITDALVATHSLGKFTYIGSAPDVANKTLLLQTGYTTLDLLILSGELPGSNM